VVARATLHDVIEIVIVVQFGGGGTSFVATDANDASENWWLERQLVLRGRQPLARACQLRHSMLKL
jgi:hypothetical protein